MALNSNLKKAIVIKDIEEVDESFHSRFNAKSKTYRYVINNSKEGSAILRGLEYHFPQKLDVDKMQEAASLFVGTHDFKGFKSSGTSSAKSSVRTIYNADVSKKEDRIVIELTGNGFLYNMVRIISGTLVEVRTPEKLHQKKYHGIIDAKDRQKAGKTLPAHGLYLVEVKYE